MSDASPISLKVKLEEDIRRFSVSRDITYVDLRNLVAKHFALAPENVHLKYVDDEEELITLGSDLELQEAKRLQPTVLRLNAYAKSSKGTAPQEPSLEAQFVRDVTVPDSTSVSAGVRFEKVWRVKNSGPASWPTGVMLKMVDPSDNHLLVLAVGAIKRAVAPGEETDIGVELQAPSRPGRCHQHWRLFTPDGEAFGPRLWIEIMVTTTTTTAKESAQETEAEIRQQKEQERLAAERLEQEELEERRRLEEAIELQRQALEEELRKRQEEEEERRRQEEEEERRLQEEAAAAAEEARKMQQEEEERQRQEEEAAAAAAAAERLRRQQEEEAEMARKEQVRRQEEERKKKEEEEKAQQLFRKYPSQLVALTEMGFSDLERNVQLLDRHKGSLDLALEALLSATN